MRSPTFFRSFAPGYGGWLRVGQFARAARARLDPAADAELRALLANEAQWRLLERLTPYDRAHVLRVRRLLVDFGHNDPDLLRAALLHDVGKADEQGRVRLAHRVAIVLLRRLTTGLLRRLTDRPRGGALRGLYLAERHAELGARLAAEAGASARCCELIARHEQLDADADSALAALQAADATAGA